MLKTSPTQLAENSPLSMDGVKDAEVGNGTSSITRSAKNSSASVKMAEDAKVGGNNCGDNETVKKSPSRRMGEPIGYFTFLCSGKR